MTVFLIAAAALASAVAAVMVARAAGAAREAAAEVEDPAVQVYRRQLTEVDDLAARGLLDEADRRTAFTETGRRLLSAQREAAAAAPDGATRRGARAIAATAAGAAVAAIALYLAVGAPGAPDDPFSARLARWRSADPQTLGAPQMAAVLEAIGRQRPDDPQLFTYLGRARLAAGDGHGAVEALRRAAQLAPRDARALVLLGEAQASLGQDGRIPADAEASFRKALAMDPADAVARYAVAKAQIQRGDVVQGLAGWKALRDGLPADDARRGALDRQIIQVEGAAPMAPAAGDAAADNPQAAMIQGMVDRLAARLARSPDDPAGWARLVRSYGVLGRAEQQAKALAEARRLFAGRPRDLALVEAQAPP